MYKKFLIFLEILLLSVQLSLAVDQGYFDTQSGSEYLGFSKMNKEFKITSLMNSSMQNDAKATKIFIASGANVNQKNIAGVTALHLACRSGSYEAAQVLVQNGANINAKDNEGWTPLMRASLNGNQRLIQLLIDNHVLLWETNSFGESALVHTAMSDCYDCAEIILKSTEDNNNISNNVYENNYEKNNQIKKSLVIVSKRYNEQFMKLLNDNLKQENKLTFSSNINSDNVIKDDVIKMTKIRQDKINDENKNGNITTLIYKFMGNTQDKNTIKNNDVILKNNEKNQSKTKSIADKKKESQIIEKNKDCNNQSKEITNTKKPKFAFTGQTIVDDKTNSKKIQNVESTKKVKELEAKNIKVNQEFKKSKIKDDVKTSDKKKFSFSGTSKNEKEVILEKNNIKNKNISKKSFVFNGGLNTSIQNENNYKKSEDKKIKSNSNLMNNENDIIENEVVKTKSEPNKKLYKIKTKKEKTYSFNNNLEDKKKNMKIINNNLKLNPDNMNYSLENPDNSLTK